MTDLDKELEDVKSIARSHGLRDVEPSPDLTDRIMGAIALEKVRERSHDLEPPPDLAGRVVASVDAEKARLRSFRRLFRWTAGIAAASAVAFVTTADFKTRGASATMDRELAVAVSMAGDAADWLVAQQCDDGTWSPSSTGGNETFRPALTALALMALQHHAPVRHAEAIGKAEKALIAMQLQDGSFSKSESSKLYNHAFVTFALLGLARERGDTMSPSMRRAVAFSLKNQNHFGAWDYSSDDPGNTALTVWQLGLLIRARQLGWNDERGQLRRGLAWLKMRGHDGVFDYRAELDRKYTPHSGSITLTAMATSTLLEAAVSFTDLRETAENAAESLKLAYERSEERESCNHYRDYFLTRVFNDVESSNAITERIVSRHVQSSSSASAPWKAQDVWATTGGDLYATVMTMLSLPGPRS